MLPRPRAAASRAKPRIPLKEDTFHTPLPKGPAGQFSYHVPFSNLVMGYSKNQKAAKDFLRWICSKESAISLAKDRNRDASGRPLGLPRPAKGLNKELRHVAPTPNPEPGDGYEGHQEWCGGVTSVGRAI